MLVRRSEKTPPPPVRDAAADSGGRERSGGDGPFPVGVGLDPNGSEFRTHLALRTAEHVKKRNVPNFPTNLDFYNSIFCEFI